MATKTILVQRKFCIYSMFLDTTLQAEDERLEGETIEDGIIRVHKQLEQTAERLRKEANPHLYQESKPMERVDGGMPFRTHPATTAESLPIISKDVEKIEISIDNATTLDELKAVKEMSPVMPHPVLVLYNKKIKELSNGE